MTSSLITYKEKLLLESFRPKPPDLLLKEELNRGAYGVIHRGVFGDRPVAVKKIHKLLLDAAKSKEVIKYKITEFKKEADMLETVQHPHVVKSLGAFYDPKTREPILVMELMAMDLRTFLVENEEPGALKVSKQVNICFQIAQGLQYLHHLSPPLAHRDLNDKNVLLAEDGTVKIGDLGQSKYKDMKQIYFETKAPGNISFMPPETLRDKPHYTESVDIFSLGVLALEVATQSLPSVGIVGIGVVPEVERRANDLKKMGHDHPLKPLVLKCLKDNYKERPSIDLFVSEMFIETVSRLEASNHELTKERDTANKELDAAKEELDASREEIDARIQHEVKITRELRASNEEKSRLQETVSSLDAMNHKLGKELHAAKEEIDARIQHEVKMTRELRATVEEKSRLQETVSSLQSSNHKLTEGLDAVREELDAVREELDDAREEIDSRFQHEVKITRQLRTSNEEKNQLERDLHELQDQCQAIQLQLHLNKDEFEQERHDRETASGRYEEEKEQLLRTIEDMQQNMKEKDDEMSILSEQWGHSLSTFQELERKSQRQETEHQKVKQQLRRENDQLKQQQTKLTKEHTEKILFIPSQKQAYWAALCDGHSRGTQESKTQTVFESFKSAAKEAVVAQTEFIGCLEKVFDLTDRSISTFTLHRLLAATVSPTMFMLRTATVAIEEARQAYNIASSFVKRLYKLYEEILQTIRDDDAGCSFPEVHNLLFAHLAGVHMHGVKDKGDELCSDAENLAIYHKIRKQAEEQIESSKHILINSKFYSVSKISPNFAFPVGFNLVEGGSVDVVYTVRTQVTRLPIATEEADMRILRAMCIATLQKERDTIVALCNL